MIKLQFERTKYGKELLIDACNESELEIVSDVISLAFYTFIFLEKASGTYYLDAEIIPLGDQMVLFVKPGQISKVDRAKFEKCHFLFFEGDFLDEFFNDKDFMFKFGYFHNAELPSYLRLEPTKFLSYYNLAKELRMEIHQQTTDSVHILRSIIYYLLVRLNQDYAQVNGTSQQTITNPTVLAFLRLLDATIKEQKTVEGYAKDLRVSRVQLNHLCQRYLSKTANQIMRERTLAAIKKELKYSTNSFSEIAYEYNFSAPSHFSRFVKQMTGLSPQAYKDSLSNW